MPAPVALLFGAARRFGATTMTTLPGSVLRGEFRMFVYGMETYSKALKIIERELGVGVTADDELDRVGHFLFRDAWAGVAPADRLLALTPAKPFGIVNTRPPPGEHWMGVCYEDKRHHIVYDSFGRQALRITSHPKKLAPRGIHIEDTDQDAEQRLEEENCGQRSLAWLCVAALRGVDVARTI